MFRSNRLGAHLVGLPIVLGGTLVVMTTCTWVSPVVVAVVHGGLKAVLEIQLKERFFPGVATWMSPVTADLLGGLEILSGFVGLVVGAMLSIRCWRNLVVHKLQWLTLDDFEKMLKGYGDF